MQISWEAVRSLFPEAFQTAYRETPRHREGREGRTVGREADEGFGDRAALAVVHPAGAAEGWRGEHGDGAGVLLVLSSA